jgi:hypothetical protein
MSARVKAFVFLLPLFAHVLSCSSEDDAAINDSNESTALVAGSGYVDIMPPARSATFKALLPRLEDLEMQFVINDPATMWYDSISMIPGYQDSMGDPEGFRPNTIQPFLIDAAVPGGSQRLFANRGRFNFPFGTGGADLSDNMVKVNFWAPPRGAGNRVLPVAYWRLSFSRWRWLFPVGTVIGEVLLVKFPDGDMRIFEIRTRKRQQSGWVNQVFRPFLKATDLAEAVKEKRPEWHSIASLRNVISHLENNNNLVPRTLATQHYSGAFEQVNGFYDSLPDFGDPTLVKSLLKDAGFRSAAGTSWKTNGSRSTNGATTSANYSIVPKNYDGGVFPIDDVFCRRCHQDAGRQIGNFHDDLVAYGELWGEDETFSWHPYENSAFVRANGDVESFNNDNRRLRRDFVDAGLVEVLDRSRHPDSLYKELPRDWRYNPF